MAKPSPFPGMDPFLEVSPRWQAFHAWFMRKLAEQSLPKAQELGCWIDVERTLYRVESSNDDMRMDKSDRTVGTDLDPSKAERIKHDCLVVRELEGQFPSVLAVAEVLSPINKNGSCVSRYVERRTRFLASQAHFMEIDFLRDGNSPSRQLFSELPPTPYFILVARKTGLGRNEEGYPLRLQDPLPVVGLPVGPGRADLPLDLVAAFRAAYDLSIRPGSISYAEETVPEPPLSEADAAWVSDLIRARRPDKE